MHTKKFINIVHVRTHLIRYFRYVLHQNREYQGQNELDLICRTCNPNLIGTGVASGNSSGLQNKLTNLQIFYIFSQKKLRKTLQSFDVNMACSVNSYSHPVKKKKVSLACFKSQKINSHTTYKQTKFWNFSGFFIFYDITTNNNFEISITTFGRNYDSWE